MILLPEKNIWLMKVSKFPNPTPIISPKDRLLILIMKFDKRPSKEDGVKKVRYTNETKDNKAITAIFFELVCLFKSIDSNAKPITRNNNFDFKIKAKTAAATIAI